MIAVCFKGQKKTHKCNTWAEQSISEFKPASTYRDDWALRSLKKQRQKKSVDQNSEVLIVNILGLLQHVSVQTDHLQ